MPHEDALLTHFPHTPTHQHIQSARLCDTDATLAAPRVNQASTNTSPDSVEKQTDAAAFLQQGTLRPQQHSLRHVAEKNVSFENGT